MSAIPQSIPPMLDQSDRFRRSMAAFQVLARYIRAGAAGDGAQVKCAVTQVAAPLASPNQSGMGAVRAVASPLFMVDVPAAQPGEVILSGGVTAAGAVERLRPGDRLVLPGRVVDRPREESVTLTVSKGVRCDSYFYTAEATP